MQRKTGVTHIGKDGNCFYRCLSQELYGDQHSHPYLRSTVVTGLETNEEKYGMYVDGNFLDHVENMKKTDGRVSSWATEAEIYAAADTLKRDIFLMNQSLSNAQWLRFSAQAICSHEVPFIAIIYDSNHYNHIRLTRRPYSCLTQEERPTQINFVEPVCKNKEREKTSTANSKDISMKMPPLRRSLRNLERS